MIKHPESSSEQFHVCTFSKYLNSPRQVTWRKVSRYQIANINNENYFFSDDIRLVCISFTYMLLLKLTVSFSSMTREQPDYSITAYRRSSLNPLTLAEILIPAESWFNRDN